MRPFAGSLDPARHESFLNLENEIAALKKRAEKRRMAVERAEEEARRAAENERLPYGRREVPAVAPATPEPQKVEGAS